MSDDTRKRWVPPDWLSAENVEREDRLLSALRRQLEAARAATLRLETAGDVSAWEARMTGAIADAEDWAGRFNRLAPAPNDRSAA